MDMEGGRDQPLTGIFRVSGHVYTSGEKNPSIKRALRVAFAKRDTGR
jgi:hypothetical protein